MTAFFADLGADLADAGLDSADVHKVMAAADKHQPVLNEVTEPRLLHGDLWTVHVMMASEHIGAIRLERHRWGNTDAVPETYDQMRNVLD